MAVDAARTRGEVVLERGELRVVVTTEPFSIRIRRGERRLVRGLRPWSADGRAEDRFVQLTEGVLAREELDSIRRVERVEEVADVPGGVEVRGRLGRRREVTARIELHDERVTIELGADPAPLRVGVDWEARSGERFTGLGARHGEEVDQSGRACPARRRPPLHRPGLPARHARGRRHPAGRLRAGAVGAR